MNHLIWRLHRQQAIFAGAALVLLAVVLLVTGVTMANDYHSALSNCGATRSCGDLPGELFHGDGLIIDLVSFTFVVPLLFGLFWGAPLVAKEFEQGTQDLVWTQGVTRRRWMTSNVACVLIAAAAWGGALSLLVTWWRGPEDALHGGRFGVAFDITGVTPVAYDVFAVALGLAAGTMLRRRPTRDRNDTGWIYPRERSGRAMAATSLHCSDPPQLSARQQRLWGACRSLDSFEDRDRSCGSSLRPNLPVRRPSCVPRGALQVIQLPAVSPHMASGGS